MSVTSLTQAIDRLNHDVVVTNANYGATGNGTTDTYAFGCGLANLRLDANARPGLTPVSSTKLQENSGLHRVWIDSYMNVPTVDLRSIGENTTLSDVYMVPHPSSTM